MSKRKKTGRERHKNNMAVMFGLRKVNAFLKKNKLWQFQQKRIDKINLFRIHHDNLEPLTKGTTRWLIETWRSGQHQILKPNPPTFGFYSSPGWLAIKRKIFKKYEKVCMCCGSTDNIVVDHIKPRSLYPELELEFDNLQVLCMPCNSSKSNRTILDFRNKISQHELSTRIRGIQKENARNSRNSRNVSYCL